MSARGYLFRYQCQFQHLQNGIAITRNTHSLQTYNVSFHPNSSRRRATLMTTVTHAFSLSGSGSGAGAEYSSSGELVDIGRKERKKRIAGIDQDELLDPKLLADPDSCFCEFHGVEIHHKLHDPELHSSDNSNAQDQTQTQTPSLKLGLPMILLHGFGASVFSWNKVMKRLANLTGSKVLAFDRPAFGLTSRLDTFGTKANDVKPLNPYSMAFSVLATLYFNDFLVAEKAILVGHSAGSLVAVDAYFEAPERVAALILVAPANLPLVLFLSMRLSRLKATDQTQIIYQSREALSSVLRSALGVMLVRIIIDKFGVAAPLRTKGGDKALVEFTAAILLKGESDTKDQERCQWISKNEYLNATGIADPIFLYFFILIVTGDTDRIVPSWNAERLSRVIPHSELEVIKNCGHLPHEEKVGEFVGIVEKFLQRAFGGLEEHFLLAVT
ncbi:Alpha/beta-Hydrolases superfamily protein isoform 2 [Hibiscus syriacus]|uniref:Alpha/beta-Hydrolases superfamily protein isoform 2 n=1 Tax=Hibiscus syriacus TaxID=106335 RepID=A0A6A3AF09_HIBSY|nr:Alpha/beta-Hydrolases superfamily protein isoform 2 [Hibiscus syriacus]